MPAAPVHRLHDLLEAASQRLNRVVRLAVERTVEALGLAALSSDSADERDALLCAQFELNRKSAMFALAFEESLNERLRRECVPHKPELPRPAQDPVGMTDPFVREVRRGCAPELRELEFCLEDLLGPTVQRNPLRPEALSLALHKGVETVSANVEIRALAYGELAQLLSLEMRHAYDDIIADMREAGIAPVGLGMPPHESHHGVAPDPASVPGACEGAWAPMAPDRGPDRAQSTPLTDGPSPPEPAFEGGRHGWAVDSYHDMPTNLIRAHRDELRRAAHGGLDHVVIDFIGSLFDESLSNARVPPQVVRHIARLQLPMLRAALVDPGAFASRMHAMRSVIARITALAVELENVGAADGLVAQQFFGQVKSLADGLVDDGFAVRDIHEHILGELERLVFRHRPVQGHAEPEDAAALLCETESAHGLQQRFADELTAELEPAAGYDFLRTFLTEVWSRVLVQSAIRHGSDAEPFLRLRSAARDLSASVRPKANMQQRQEFLSALPRLMREVKEGMDLVSWPEPSRKAFFGALLPAHAESLKVPAAVPGLNWNLLVRQVENALQVPLNPQENVTGRKDDRLPVLAEVIEPADATASQRTVDIDLGAQGTTSAAGEPSPGAPESAAEQHDAAERAPLWDRVAAGCHYRMLVDGTWLKVKLTHVSPGRTFFVFTHGRRYEHTISLTHRMLARLCEGSRFKDAGPEPTAHTTDGVPASRDRAQPLTESAAA